MKYYAVRVGRKIGIFTSWEECKAQVHSFAGAEYKSFPSLDQANAYLGNLPVAPIAPAIYCDGSYANSKAGYGVVFLDGREYYGIVPTAEHSNQSAELYAIFFALYLAQQEKSSNFSIFTDSKYSIDCCTNWIHNWIRNGWRTADGNPVKHKELISSIYVLLQQTSSQLIWVKGHSGHPGNERANQLAQMATT